MVRATVRTQHCETLWFSLSQTTEINHPNDDDVRRYNDKHQRPE